MFQYIKLEAVKIVHNEVKDNLKIFCSQLYYSSVNSGYVYSHSRVSFLYSLIVLSVVMNKYLPIDCLISYLTFGTLNSNSNLFNASFQTQIAKQLSLSMTLFSSICGASVFYSFVSSLSSLYVCKTPILSVLKKKGTTQKFVY